MNRSIHLYPNAVRPAVSRREFLLGAAAFLSLPAHAMAAASATLAFENGLWFDGEKFSPGTRFSVDGRFTHRRPARVDRTLDLAGACVVSPFADAHNHGFGVKTAADDRKLVTRHLADGVFYTRMLGPTLMDETWKDALGLNRPGGLDMAFGDGMLTGIGGHPSQLQAMLLKQGLYPGLTADQLDGTTYFQIESVADLEAKWSKIRAKHGDILKVVLQSPGGRTAFAPPATKRAGLDPELLPAIVRKAHQENLPVAAHIATASDFRDAVGAGVDQLAHPPTFGMIDKADAELAARHGVVVMTTAANLKILLPPADLPEALDRLRANYRLLQAAGVKFAIGSDNVSDTSIGEVAFLREIKAFDDVHLLRIWSTDTPAAIFPKRRLGRFDDGYEASLLALDGDPLRDWSATRRIRLRVKQGVVLEEPARGA